MKPASFQSVASTVMNPNISLGHLLSQSTNVMRCEKCRFTTTDISVFKKHVAQEHTEYYCFYCNQVSLSEAELQTHLQIHTGTSPFKCPHCGQVYMRRMCLIKHIDRLHSKIVPQGQPKIIPHVSVSSASQSASSATDTLSQRPVVRVNVPTPSTAGVALDTNLQRLKSLSSYYSNANHGDGVPSNGQVQRNRALTVSLPEEVSIPAGCMVEVAEVKTVDGTKELRLRFVAQENESLTKNGRTTVPETSKVLLSQIKCPNAPSDSGMRLVNKNHVNRERPTLVPINSSKGFPNQSMEQRLSAKRLSEVINVDVPSKIPRNFISVGEAKGATQKEPINHSTTPTTMSSMLANRLATGTLLPENLSTAISLNGVEERKNCAPGPPSSLESLMMNYVQIMPHIVSLNHSSATVKAKEDSILQKNKHDLTNPQHQNLKTRLLPLKPSMVAPPQVRVTNECKDNFVSKTFIPEQGSSQKASAEPLPAKKQMHTSNTHMKPSALPQEVKTEKSASDGVRVEREGFPVISSVYSLSHQPSVPQESTQPIVMAEWTNSAGCDSLKIKSFRAEQSKMTSGHQAHKDSKETNLTLEALSNNISRDSVKVEQDQYIQGGTSAPPHNIHAKKEKRTLVKATKKSKITPKVTKTCSPLHVNKTLAPPEHVQVNHTLAPPEHVQVNHTLAPTQHVQVNHTLAPPEHVQVNHTLAPSNHAQLNHTLAPSNHAQVNHALAPTNHAQVNHALAPTNHAQVNHALAPTNHAQVNHTLAPSEHVQVNHTLAPTQHGQVNHTLAPSEHVQVNHTLAPTQHGQVNHTLAPSEHVQVNHTLAPSNHAQVHHTLAPSEHVQINHTLAPPEHVQVNKTWAAPEHVQVNQTLAPPEHGQVNTTLAPPDHVQVNTTLAPPKHVKVNKTLAPPKHVKVNKTLALPKHVKVKKTWAPPLQPIKSGPLISQPPLVIENISVENPVSAKPSPEIPSKFLTVSLKRVHVDISGKGKKKGKTILKLRLPKPLDGPRDCAALQLMPLRKHQAVKLPSPNQPVVVLNHPEPCANMKRVPANTPRNQDAIPKCQILKMKLGKVMGQKYEVMGCTIRNFS